jgi:predicted nucleotidyltransferase
MDYGLQQKDIDAINSIFIQYSLIEKVIIYGSRAKGTYKNGSDIDLTIIENGLTFTEFLEIENKLDDLLLPYKIDLSQKRKISNQDLIEHIQEFGQEFYFKKQI